MLSLFASLPFECNVYSSPSRQHVRTSSSVTSVFDLSFDLLSIKKYLDVAFFIFKTYNWRHTSLRRKIKTQWQHDFEKQVLLIVSFELWPKKGKRFLFWKIVSWFWTEILVWHFSLRDASPNGNDDLNHNWEILSSSSNGMITWTTKLSWWRGGSREKMRQNIIVCVSWKESCLTREDLFPSQRSILTFFAWNPFLTALIKSRAKLILISIKEKENNFSFVYDD